MCGRWVNPGYGIGNLHTFTHVIKLIISLECARSIARPRVLASYKLTTGIKPHVRFRVITIFFISVII